MIHHSTRTSSVHSHPDGGGVVEARGHPQCRPNKDGARSGVGEILRAHPGLAHREGIGVQITIQESRLGGVVSVGLLRRTFCVRNLSHHGKFRDCIKKNLLKIILNQSNFGTTCNAECNEIAGFIEPIVNDVGTTRRD